MISNIMRSNERGGFNIASRLILILFITIYSFLFSEPLFHLLLSAAMLVLFFNILIKISVWRVFIPLFPLLFMMFIFVGFTSPSLFHHAENQYLLFNPGYHVAFSIEGIKLGFTFVLRLINMVISTRILLYETHPDDLAGLIRSLRLPQGIAFIVSTAFRFIPEIEKKRQLIITAQRVRGADFERGGFLISYFRHMKLMVPLIINAIIMAEKLSVAMICRGYGYRNERTELKQSHFRVKDFIAMSGTGLLIIILFYIRYRYGFGRL